MSDPTNNPPDQATPAPPRLTSPPAVIETPRVGVAGAPEPAEPAHAVPALTEPALVVPATVPAVGPGIGPGVTEPRVTGPGATWPSVLRDGARTRRRRVSRPRHRAPQWPYPAPYRGARWLRWWLLSAVLAGASGALLTLGVVALHWPL